MVTKTVTSSDLTKVKDDLRAALKVRKLPPQLVRDIEAALLRYASRPDPAVWDGKWHAAKQVSQAGRALRLAITRANRVHIQHPAWIASTWNGVVPPLDRMLAELDAWLPRRAPSRGMRNPNEMRGLRIQVLSALQDAGIPLRNNGRGRAARVLAIVLAEADRINGRQPRARADFGGTQWQGWLREFKAIDEDARSGLPWPDQGLSQT